MIHDMRAASFLLVAVLVCCLLPALAMAETRASLPDIEDEVMCTICGTLLAESASPQADRERAFIRDRIAQGETKDQIKDALVAQYGENVLATPKASGFDLLAYLIPIAALLGVLAVLIPWLIRQRRRSPPSPLKDLDPSDEARLNADMARDDL
jgi:cytochrome c-type biogenesis protein CcmH/NrfF